MSAGRRARSSPMRRATASSTASSAPTARPCWRSPTCRPSTGPRASTRRPAMPVDYDPNQDIQVYSGQANYDAEQTDQEAVPGDGSAATIISRLVQPTDQARSTFRPTSCATSMTLDPGLGQKRGVYFARPCKYTERNESDIVVADPLTGEVKKRAHSPYPNASGTLTTAGGLVFTAFIGRHHSSPMTTRPRPALEVQCRHGL